MREHAATVVLSRDQCLRVEDGTAPTRPSVDGQRPDATPAILTLAARLLA
jgi:hypothetical protein